MNISKYIVLGALLGTMSHNDVVDAISVQSESAAAVQKHHHKKHKNKSKNPEEAAADAAKATEELDEAKEIAAGSPTEAIKAIAAEQKKVETAP